MQHDPAVPTTERPTAARRVLGIVVARAVAVVGMVMVHFGLLVLAWWPDLLRFDAMGDAALSVALRPPWTWGRSSGALDL